MYNGRGTSKITMNPKINGENQSKYNEESGRIR
jgi:hypothetical protein